MKAERERYTPLYHVPSQDIQSKEQANLLRERYLADIALLKEEVQYHQKQIENRKLSIRDLQVHRMQAGAWIQNHEQNAFKQSLFKDFEVSGEKAEKAYKLAYDRGHSAGNEEIREEFADLIDLIK